MPHLAKRTLFLLILGWIFWFQVLTAEGMWLFPIATEMTESVQKPLLQTDERRHSDEHRTPAAHRQPDEPYTPAARLDDTRQNLSGPVLSLKTVKELQRVKEQVKGLPSVKVTATGYTAGVESTGKTPDHPAYGITASGVRVRRDVYSTIAADPDVFPMGTILYIPGYGYGVVTDTGSAIRGHVIDLYYETVEQIYDEWGKKVVDVYLVQRGDGKVTEAMLDELNHRAKVVPMEAATGPDG